MTLPGLVNIYQLLPHLVKYLVMWGLAALAMVGCLLAVKEQQSNMIMELIINLGVYINIKVGLEALDV